MMDEIRSRRLTPLTAIPGTRARDGEMGVTGLLWPRPLPGSSRSLFSGAVVAVGIGSVGVGGGGGSGGGGGGSGVLMVLLQMALLLCCC